MIAPHDPRMLRAKGQALCVSVHNPSIARNFMCKVCMYYFQFSAFQNVTMLQCFRYFSVSVYLMFQCFSVSKCVTENGLYSRIERGGATWRANTWHKERLQAAKKRQGAGRLVIPDSRVL